MIVVVDDDSGVRSSLSLMLKRSKYDVITFSNPSEMINYARTSIPDLVLMDMNFTLSTSGDEGLHLLRQVKIFAPSVPIILMTAWGSIDLAVEGMRLGAFDFITKPWDNRVLLSRIETALQLSQSKNEHQQSAVAFHYDAIIGKSKELESVFHTLSRVARTNASVLITGESGTGKEMIAEGIHRNSNRHHKPFVKVNLGGISQSLFESEMFGHKRGAFTDAVCDRMGRFEMADGGTIFLDEIGELDLCCQVKLLRVLQDQTYEVLGDSRPRKLDVRVVAATNADLPKMVQEGKFREDLYYRINLITVTLPPLRERKEDIPLLVDFFSHQLLSKFNLPAVRIENNAMQYLCSLPYPGNIRELKNLVERTLLVSSNKLITAEDFEQQYLPLKTEGSHFDSVTGVTLEQMEKLMIETTLKKYKGNISRVAESLGISRAALYRRLEKYNIKI